MFEEIHTNTHWSFTPFSFFLKWPLKVYPLSISTQTNTFFKQKTNLAEEVSEIWSCGCLKQTVFLRRHYNVDGEISLPELNSVVKCGVGLSITSQSVSSVTAALPATVIVVCVLGGIIKTQPLLNGKVLICFLWLSYFPLPHSKCLSFSLALILICLDVINAACWPWLGHMPPLCCGYYFHCAANTCQTSPWESRKYAVLSHGWRVDLWQFHLASPLYDIAL